MDKRNSKESMLKKIHELENKIELVFDCGIEGIKHVGLANYAEREREAIANLEAVMYDYDTEVAE